MGKMVWLLGMLYRCCLHPNTGDVLLGKWHFYVLASVMCLTCHEVSTLINTVFPLRHNSMSQPGDRILCNHDENVLLILSSVNIFEPEFAKFCIILYFYTCFSLKILTFQAISL